MNEKELQEFNEKIKAKQRTVRESQAVQNVGKVLQTSKVLSAQQSKFSAEKYNQNKIRWQRQNRVATIRLKLKAVPKLFESARLSDFSPAFISQIKCCSPEQSLLFWGGPGVGKSHAAAALMRQAIVSGKSVLRVQYEMLCLQIRDAYKVNTSTSELDVIKQFLKCDLLIIEDLGATKSIGQQETDFSLRTFLVIIDTRIEQCLPTIITTNKSIENLTQSFDERIGSRLRTFNVIRMAGKDKRGSSLEQ